MWKFFLYWIGVILVMGWLCIVSLGALPDGKLHVFMLDVGQGDSMLLRTPDGKHILIDAGEGSRAREPLRKMMGLFSRRIDLVVITHFDRDHAEGFLSVFDEYDVGAVLITGVEQRTELQRRVLEKIAVHDVPVMLARADLDLMLDRDVMMDVLWPFESMAGRYVEKANETSIVTRILVRDDKKNDRGKIHQLWRSVFLTTGDIGFPTEKKLVSRYGESGQLRSEFLKVGHHGSRYSSDLEFLRAVSPRCALISVAAKNGYHHPHPDALGRLSKVTSCVRQTAKEGTIETVIDLMGRIISVGL